VQQNTRCKSTRQQHITNEPNTCMLTAAIEGFDRSPAGG